MAERPFHTDDPEETLGIPDAEGFPLVVPLEEVTLYEEPVELTQDVRRRLDAFADKDASAAWGWFVITVCELTPADYQTLTR